MTNSTPLTRRSLLRHAAGGAAGLLAASGWEAPAEAQKSPYGPFKMGIQSYSLRGFKLDQALEHSNRLGLRYWESYAAHIPLTTDPVQVRELLGKLKAANVQLLAHGVTGFNTNKEASRKVFEAAKALGVRVITADPEPAAFDHLEELIEEFKIKIAIHNHGPGHRWDKLQQVADALKGRHKGLGASADLGHFLRSNEESVKVVETLAERIHSVHLKDVKDAKTFTILGKGDMNLVGVLRALKAVKFSEVLALEYEENPQNPIADLEECLAAVRAAVEKI
jgi:inosose dehydratase